MGQTYKFISIKNAFSFFFKENSSVSYHFLTIFKEYRMRLGITFVQKQAFDLVLRSPLTIFATLND